MGSKRFCDIEIENLRSVRSSKDSEERENEIEILKVSSSALG